MSNNSVSNIDTSAKPFYKLMDAEVKQMYEEKLLDAPAYILLIVKTHGAAGWKWTFKVKDFCIQWGIPERTFYRAISKLKTMGKLHWEVKEAGVFSVYHKTVHFEKPKGYKKFLQGKYWRAVRQMVIDRDKGMCQHCSSQKELEVHHLTYAHHRNEREHLEDLTTLCSQCHAIAHRK